MKSLPYLCLAAALFLLVTACTGAAEIGEPPADAVCSSLVNEKCTKCHYLTRVCDALGTKSMRNWRKTIGFMLKQGAQLTPDEQNKIIACLSSLPSGSAVVCQ